jgi:hypothetical protein
MEKQFGGLGGSLSKGLELVFVMKGLVLSLFCWKFGEIHRFSGDLVVCCKNRYILNGLAKGLGNKSCLLF